MPKLTKEMLIAAGFEEEAAEAVVKLQDAKVEKTASYVVKVTPARLAQLQDDNPDLEFKPRFPKRN